jgi:hypothetical protein
VPGQQSNTVNASAPFTLDESGYGFINIVIFRTASPRQLGRPDRIASLPSHLNFSSGPLHQKVPLENNLTGLPMPCRRWEHAIPFKQTFHNSRNFSNRNTIGTKHPPLRDAQMERNHKFLKQSFSSRGHFIMIPNLKIAITFRIGV